MIKIYLLLLFNFAFVVSPANVIKGRVVADKSGKPVVLASVFISQTSTGTITDSKGFFSMNVAVRGFLKLVITHLNYETYTVEINENNPELYLEVKLKEKLHELNEFRVYPRVWSKKYYQIFIDRFIGPSDNAYDCEIINPKAINFYGSRKGYIKAQSDSNLVIINKALGYKIFYRLDKFELYYRIDSTWKDSLHLNIADEKGRASSGTIVSELSESNSQNETYTKDMEELKMTIAGEPRFEDILSLSGKPQKVLKQRARAYRGSPMHFFRSLYADSLDGNGFKVYKIKATKIIRPVTEIRLFTQMADSTHHTKEICNVDTVMIKYMRAGEPETFIDNPDNYKRLKLTRGQQTSILGFYKTSFTPMGIAKKYIRFNGYMHWLRLAELLPYDFDESTIVNLK